MPKAKKPTKSNSDTDALRRQLEELTEALQRERADADNIRRRHEAEISKLRASVKIQVISDLLPIIDNFELALKHIPKDLASNDYVKGVQGIVRQFEATLEQMGVARIKTVDQPFDPQLHEAVSIEEGNGQHEVVSEELQAGYCLGNTVIRHATVRVKMQ